MFKRIITILTILILSHQPLKANDIASPQAIEGFESAVLAFNEKDFLKAKAIFEKILDKQSKHLDAIIYLARINAREGELDDAEDLIEKALKLAPENAMVQNLSGKIYGSIAQDASIFTALGYAEDSLNGFTRAVEIEPGNVDYRKDLISFHVGAPSIAGGDRSLALTHALAVQEIDPRQGYMTLANVYFATDEKEKLNLHFAQMPESLSQDAEVFYTKGLIEQGLQSFDKAIKSLQSAVEFAADVEAFQINKYAALYQIGKTAVLSQSNVDEGLMSLAQFIAEAPEIEELPSKEWAEFRQANLMALKGDKASAETAYRKIAKLTKDKTLKKEAKKLF